jgi:hypothetical protein
LLLATVALVAIALLVAAPSPSRFLSTPDREWQRTSLLALSCCGVNTVTIE